MNFTHNNNELTKAHIGQHVSLKGWVAKKRNLGSLVFIDLRDRYGITQIICDEKFDAITSKIRNEYVIHVLGEVVERASYNPNLKTGEIEVKVSAIEILNKAETTPLIIADQTDALEDTRMKYRYLDLRRPIMQQNMILRHQITRSMRSYLDNLEFIDVETPILTKSTPEGARDYLVPSRVHDECFYALPQSPQLFKQLLMVAGFERYYQIARCFRDEDLRADRQPEFTQLDMEMSFLSQDQIQELVEGMFKKLIMDVKGVEIKTPFEKITYFDAMSTYGSDKPDTRFDLKLHDMKEVFKETSFAVFKDAIANGLEIKAINVKGQAGLSRKEIDKLTDLVKKYGAKGLAWLKVENASVTGPIAKFLTENEVSELLETLTGQDNDLILFVADKFDVTCNALGALRSHFAKVLNLTDPNEYDFKWIVDWPLFEYDEKDERYYAAHHPFTRPRDEDRQKMWTNPNEVIAQAYDLVLNGFEIGGGSLRIYDEELQTRMFEVLGFDQQTIDERFGFFIEAFKYGTPPHGGIAFGLDRIAMILTNSESLRDVIAFPKNASATCPMTNAPSFVDDKQKEELGITTYQK